MTGMEVAIVVVCILFAVAMLAAFGAVLRDDAERSQPHPGGAGCLVPLLSAVAGPLEELQFTACGKGGIIQFQNFIAIFHRIGFQFLCFGVTVILMVFTEISSGIAAIFLMERVE